MFLQGRYPCCVITNSKVTFKSYDPKQMLLLPPSLEELIEANHPVRVVDQVIERINIEPLLAAYQGGGTSSYHPRMMLKVIVFAYLSNIYSSRKIEAALKENILFMWISAMNKPDHNSINRFRSERLQKPLKEIFVQIVELLAAEGLLDIKELYTDGTKIEANANRYTFVWGKSVERSRERIKKQVDELWQYAQHIASEELADTAPLEFDPADPVQVEKTIEKIDQVLSDKNIDPKVRQKINYAKKNWPENVRKYKQQEAIIKQSEEKRTSYSKTDSGATFMRMKEDHMLNGQLKAAYNLQLSSNNRYIINYTLHQSSADTSAFIAHLEQYRRSYKQSPSAVTADSGYGSEENYAFLEKNKIEAFVKYNYFHLEQRTSKQNRFAQHNLPYDEQTDSFTCPTGKHLYNIGTYKKRSDNGYTQIVTDYQSEGCSGCSLKDQCHKRAGDRIISVNHQLRQYKTQAKLNLTSERGIQRRKNRPADIEQVFAQIKHNKHFKRFLLRGKDKVTIETGLIAIAHNLAKKAAQRPQN